MRGALIRSLTAYALFSLAVIFAGAQEDGILVIAGPFGTPVSVRDLGGTWSTPILIYSDADLETFVPDITTPGWIFWFGGRFQQTGMYTVYLYTHYKNDHWCMENVAPATGHPKDPAVIDACVAMHYRRTLIEVDTRRKTMQIKRDNSIDGRGAGMPWENNWYSRKPTSLVDLAGTPTGKKIARITAIIEEETKH
jgi:hypothetical protein